MDSLKQLRIGNRLALAFAIVLALMLVVFAVGVHGIYRVAAGLETVYKDRTVPLAQLGELNNLASRNRLLIVEMLRAPGFDEIKRRSDELNTNLKRGNELIELYLATQLTADERALAERYVATRKAYIAEGLLPVSAALSTGGMSTAMQIYEEKTLPLATKTRELADELVKLQVDVAAAEYQQGQATRSSAVSLCVALAAFALLLGLSLVALPALAPWWVPALAVLAAATMLYGAFAALAQHDVKRILAYSSITHAGYATIGVVALSRAGLSATLLYLLTYAVGTLAAFGVVIAIERRRRGEVTLTNLRGLGRTSPLLAGILALALLSLAGLPLTAGFIGKLEVFRAGVAGGFTWLVVIGVASSLVAAFFYLRIAGIMFLEDVPATDDPDEEAARMPVLSGGLSSATAIAAALIVVIGIQPAVLLDLADFAGVLLR